MAEKIKSQVIIWTRSQADWDADQALFSNSKSSIHHYPTIRHVPNDLTPIGIQDPQPHLAIMTSAYAASFELMAPWLPILKNIPIFCVGEITAETVRSIGLNGIHPESIFSARDLAIWLDKAFPQKSAMFLGVDRPAFDWRQWAVSSQRPFQFHALYRLEIGLWTSQGKPLTQAQKLALRNLGGGVVCFASPSAVQGFCSGLWPEDIQHNNEGEILKYLPTNLMALGIGPTTTAQCKGLFSKILMTSRPSLALLAQLALEQVTLGGSFIG